MKNYLPLLLICIVNSCFGMAHKPKAKLLSFLADTIDLSQLKHATIIAQIIQQLQLLKADNTDYNNRLLDALLPDPANQRIALQLASSEQLQQGEQFAAILPTHLQVLKSASKQKDPPAKYDDAAVEADEQTEREFSY